MCNYIYRNNPHKPKPTYGNNSHNNSHKHHESNQMHRRSGRRGGPRLGPFAALPFIAPSHPDRATKQLMPIPQGRRPPPFSGGRVWSACQRSARCIPQIGLVALHITDRLNRGGSTLNRGEGLACISQIGSAPPSPPPPAPGRRPARAVFF